MSRRINTFASVITQPLNVYNFEIRIESLTDKVNSDILLTVQSTQFPSETMREMTLNYQGETIVYPAKPQLGGDWSFSIPEGDGGQVRNELDRLKNTMYDQKTGMMIPKQWYDVTLIQKDLSDNIVFKTILHGCWMKGRNATDLKTDDVSASWNLQYTFHYTWLEDVLLKDNKYPSNNDKTSNPMGVNE